MRFLLGFVFALFLCAAVGFGMLYMGWYPVNADTDPSWIENKLAKMALNSYVEKQAKDLPENPLKATAEVQLQGLKIYKSNCAGCHGSPADKEGMFGKAFFPKAPQFWKKGLGDDAREIFWITKHGIRMSGMPAFTTMMSDEEIWKVVTFISNISTMPAAVNAEWQKS